MDSNLEGMTVWITGASGGIGQAGGGAFGAEGCNLVLHAHANAEALGAFAASRPWSARSLCVQADVRDPDQLWRNCEEAGARFGRVDACIINAGIWPSEDLGLHEMPIQRVRDVIEIDLLGALWSARAFLRALADAGPREDGRGASLCFVGSTAGRFGEAGHVEYAASKAALHGVVRSLKNEITAIDPYGRVNMVEPGWTVTPMAGASLDEPGTIERVLATMPVRQIARPQDIASAALYLTAPGLSRHVTGEVITVAGGMEGRVQWSSDQIDPAAVRARLGQT